MSKTDIRDIDVAKEFKTARSGGGLGKSVDILRECIEDMSLDVQELYDLDEDNFQKIQSLVDGLGAVKKRVDGLQIQIRRNRRKVVFGFIGIGGLLYLGKKALDAFDKRIEKLEQSGNAAESCEKAEEQEKAEESDG